MTRRDQRQPRSQLDYEDKKIAAEDGPLVWSLNYGEACGRKARGRKELPHLSKKKSIIISRVINGYGKNNKDQTLPKKNGDQ